LNSSSAANPVATPVATTNYVVQVSNGGCVNTDTVRVIVSQPTVDAGSDVAICAGGSAQLNATGSGTFLWSPASGLSATNIASPVAQPAVTTLYTVTLSDSVNCGAVDSVLVTVNPLPTVDAGADTSACINEQISLGGSPTGPAGSTYSWSPAGGLSSTTAANPLATITGTVTYTVTVTDGNTCVDSGAITINGLAIPDVDAGADTSICAGQIAQLNGSGNGTLVWSPIFGLSDPNIPNPTANPEATTTYTLTVTGGNLCTNTDQTTVTVNVLPNANAGPDLSVCLGDSVQIQASGPGTYSWTPAATLSNPNIANPLASPVVSTVYTLTLTDDQACSRSDSMLVTVVQPVNAGTNGSTSICGTAFPLTLFNLIGGNPPVGGTWVAPDGSPSTGVYTPGSSLPGAYAYVVAATTPCPNDTAFVTVAETPAADAGESAFLQLCSNSSPVDLFTILGGTPQTGGQWTDSNGQPSTGIFDPAVSGSDIITYLVTAPLPCTDAQASVTIVVNPALDPGTSGTVTTCASGLIFNLTDSLGGTPDPNGVWLDPDGVQHGPLFGPSVDPAGAWTYFVAGANGCADTSAVLNVIVTTPNTQILGDNEICIGDTTQLSNTGNVSHVWSPATGVSDASNSAPLFFPSATTTYSLTVTDAAGCIGTDSVVVTVNALPFVDAGPAVGVCVGGSTPIGGTPTGPTGSTYLWSPSAGLNNTTAANPVAQPANTSTYTVFVTDLNQCSAADSVTVTVNPLPLLEAGNDTSFCQGGSVQLNATGLGTFLWSPSTGLNTVDGPNPIASPATTTSYSVSLTDANNCTSSDALIVTVLGLPNADAGADQYLCPGFGVQLSGTGGGSANWTPNATLDNANILNPVASPVVTTTYTLVITDGNGCTDNDDVVVQVSTDPPADAGPDQSVCLGGQVTLGGNPTNIPGTSVLWSPSTDLSDVNASNPVSTPQATTLYTVTVTSDTCTSQDVVLVTLQGIAEAAFTMRLEPGCDELRAFFTDQSSGAAQWAWDFGDGSTSTEQNPQHLFTYGQPITVTLVVTDNLGCTGSITQTFQTSNFDDFVDYQIPNVFTPNGDGKNDVFTLNTNGFLGPCVNLQVFNRWGQKMFESFGNDITWTGRNFAGEECVTGTYFYTLTLNDMSFNGNVYLNR
jgi:gliding motility-associated-like protein